MLPSRGIARSLPSTGAWRQTSNRLTALPVRRLGNGRQFGTSLRSTGGGLTTGSLFRNRYTVAPIALGGVASTRSLSLWGYGKKSTPTEEIAAAAPESIAEAASTPVAEVTEAATAQFDAAAAAASSAVEPIVETTDAGLASISELINNNDILNMPEQLGYLHAIGLDYGWGPTSVMQWALEHMHIWTGLGWGASVMVTAVALRAIMFYPQVQSLKFNAIMQKMRLDPRSKEAMKLVQQGFQSGDMELRQKGQVLNKLVRQEYGVSNMGIMWSLAQIPFTFGLFRIVSGMAHIPVPSLETAGFLWFPDLAATDPYFILPAAGTALMMSALIINAKHSPPQQKKMLKPMMYIFGTVGFIGTTFLSAAVNLMTVALGASTLITAVILNAPAVRRAVGLSVTPVDGATPAATQAQYEAPRPSAPGLTGVKDKLNSSLNDMKKSFSEQVGNYTGTYSGTEQEKAEKKRKEMLRKLEDMRKKQEQEEFERKYKGKK